MVFFTKDAQAQQVRMILLGPGESGKSTFFKQLKIIQGGGIGEEERKRWAVGVFANIRSQMQILVQQARDEEVEFSEPSSQDMAQKILSTPADSEWSSEFGMWVKKMWAEPAIKTIYQERDRLFSLNDGAAYFFTNIDRIMEPNYIPSQQDLLCVRVRSAAFEQAVYSYNKITFKIWDVGGQIPERKKWRRHIGASTAIIFFASLTEYDQRMREDHNRIRMMDTLDMFEEICILEETAKKPIILLLNKIDLLKEKIARKNLNSFFPEYTGPADAAVAAEYIRDRYIDRAHNHDVYPHFICAVDTVTVTSIWSSVRDILYKKTIVSATKGMM